MGKNKRTHLLIVLVVAARALLVITCEEVAWKQKLYFQVVSKRLEIACKSDLSLHLWKWGVMIKGLESMKGSNL